MEAISQNRLHSPKALFLHRTRRRRLRRRRRPLHHPMRQAVEPIQTMNDCDFDTGMVVNSVADVRDECW